MRDAALACGIERAGGRPRARGADRGGEGCAIGWQEAREHGKNRGRPKAAHRALRRGGSSGLAGASSSDQIVDDISDHKQAQRYVDPAKAVVERVDAERKSSGARFDVCADKAEKQS